MRILLLLLIKLYWVTVSKGKRRRCIFNTSCSQHVYQATKKNGLYQGLIALNYRIHNCKSGFKLFENDLDGSMYMILPDGSTVRENEIAERFVQLKKIKAS